MMINYILIIYKDIDDDTVLAIYLSDENATQTTKRLSEAYLKKLIEKTIHEYKSHNKYKKTIDYFHSIVFKIKQKSSGR